MDARIVLRDQNLSVVDRHFLTDHKRKIPVVAFLDPDYREVARWVERPAAADALYLEGGPALRERLRAMVDSGAFQRAVLDEWRAALGG